MKEKQVLIVGMGRAGVSLAQYLLSRGAAVIAADDDPNAFKRDSVTSLQQNPAFRVVSELSNLKVDFAIASPGIPDDAPGIRSLREQGIRVIDEVEFAYEIVGKRIVAVTGTNGKSTTTTLIGEMLRADGKNIFYGGNLAPGMPFSRALLDEPKDFYVVEVSTFQLERCERFAPKVAVLLNVAEDHLNRHGTMDRYLELKFSVFRNQVSTDFAVINRDDSRIMARASSIKAQPVTFSVQDPQADAAVRAGMIEFRGKPVLPVQDVRLPGRHNTANALAAIAACSMLGAGPDSMAGVLRTFAGLEHRLELVLAAHGVGYVNNSMCTNPAAAIQSLLAFDRPVVLITGGREKDLPIDGYLDTIKRRAKIAILVGENRVRLLDGLRAIGFQAAETAESLPAAVHQARRASKPGDIVLFSPGFASFDEYRDFQDRGRAFRQAVRDELACAEGT